MQPGPILKRLREGGIVGALAVYLGAAWVAVQVVLAVRDLLRLPDWIGPATLVLLLIGLAVVLATVWIQSHPLTTQREQTGELPRDWELGTRDLLRSLRAGRLPHLNWGRALTGGVVALSLLFGVAGAYVVVQDGGRAFRTSPLEATEAGVGVAVLPFEQSGTAGGDALLGEGMMDLLATNIDAITGLRAISPSAVVARNVAAGDDARVLELGRSLSAGYVVTGRVTGIGDRLRAQADVMDTRTGRRIGAPQHAEGTTDELVALVDQLSIRIASVMLQQHPEYATGFRPSLSLTSSPAALRAFLEGEALFRRLDFGGAITAFERALDADSTFALAWMRKGLALGWMGHVTSPLPSLRAALRHADRLPQRDRMLLDAEFAISSFDYSKLPSIESATRHYPDDAALWSALGEFYVHHGPEALISVQTAQDALLQAVRLQPDFYPHYIHPIELAVVQEDTAAADALLAASVRGLDASTAVALRLVRDLAFGAPDAALRAAEAIDTLSYIGTSLEVALSLPRLLEHKERHVRVRHASPTASARSARVLFTTLTVRGKFGEAAAALNDVLHTQAQRSISAFMLYMQGAAPPAGGWDPYFRLAAIDTSNAAVLVFAAVYAAERGDNAEHERAVQHLNTQERLRTERGDTAVARTIRLRLAAIDGHTAWRRGQLAEARRLFTSVLPAIGSTHGRYVRWWLAEVLNELGEDDAALRYYASLRQLDNDFNELPLRHLRIAAIHERNGRHAEARASLAELLEIWKDADPDHPPLREAGAHLARLAER